MDFIEALPKMGGKSVILTMVDHLSKYAHFIPLAHPYSARTVAHKIFSEIVKLHGLPKSIVSDRDVVFTSIFWQELFKLSSVKLQVTSAYHPQSDGQSMVVNKIITMYLCCLIGDRPKEWIRWLPWVEFCYNTTYHKSNRTTLFKLVYGCGPPQLKSYSLGDAAVPSVDDLLTEQDPFLEQTKVYLQQSQDYYSKYYDNKHTDRTFEVGDWVWLKLMTQTAVGISNLQIGKLALKYFRPFQISECITSVAYRLNLLEETRIHNAFHVSVLKKHKGTPPSELGQVPTMHEGAVVLEPDLVLKSWLYRGQL
jgi:hypothetical protein